MFYLRVVIGSPTVIKRCSTVQTRRLPHVTVLLAYLNVRVQNLNREKRKKAKSVHARLELEIN